jgi:histone H2B
MSKGKPIVNFNIYIKQILNMVHANTGITLDSKSQVSSFLYVLSSKIAKEASFLANANFGKSEAIKQHTLTAKEIQSAILIVMPPEISKHAISEGQKALNKYSESYANKGNLKIRKSAASRAGILIPPSRVNKIIRLNHCGRVGSGSSVYLASVLEYIAVEILELAGDSLKHGIINAHDLMNAIKNDEELNILSKNIKWETIGGGKNFS